MCCSSVGCDATILSCPFKGSGTSERFKRIPQKTELLYRSVAIFFEVKYEVKYEGCEQVADFSNVMF